MKKLKNISASLLLTLGAVSCSFLDVEPVVITDDTYYNSEEEVLYGLAGVYGAINNEAFYGNYYSLMLSNTDDLCYYNRTSANNYSVWYQHDASSPEIYDAWTMIYKGIGNANSFMEAVADSEHDSDHKYWNEARFIRAWYYFILAQAWGDVPLRTTAATSPSEVSCPATSQLEVLRWVISEMESCLALADMDLTESPSRVTKTTMWGILARVNLFTAGATVSGNDQIRHDCYGKAMAYADSVIQSGLHRLNPSYSQVFINMISDQYDTEYHESMWEADFMGNRSSSSNWSNGFLIRTVQWLSQALESVLECGQDRRGDVSRGRRGSALGCASDVEHVSVQLSGRNAEAGEQRDSRMDCRRRQDSVQGVVEDDVRLPYDSEGGA